MMNTIFRVIDPVATGENIVRLRKERGLSVRDLQTFFGFEEPQAIYKWQRGQSLPTVDNLFALSALLSVPMEGILVERTSKPNMTIIEPHSGEECGSRFFPAGHPLGKIRQRFQTALTIFLLAISGTCRQAPGPV